MFATVFQDGKSAKKVSQHVFADKFVVVQLLTKNKNLLPLHDTQKNIMENSSVFRFLLL